MLEHKKLKKFIQTSNALNDIEISHPPLRLLVNEFLAKFAEVNYLKETEFSNAFKSIVYDLENSLIIKTNNKSKVSIIGNRIIYNMLKISPETESEINKIINLNFEKYNKRLLKEFSNIVEKSFFEKNIKKMSEEYLINYKLFSNKLITKVKHKSFCLVECYSIKLDDISEEEIESIYESERANKENLELAFINVKEKFDSIKVKLNDLNSTNSMLIKNDSNIKIKKTAPLLSFYEIFLFLFLISISLISIFVLFKKSFDEEN